MHILKLCCFCVLIGRAYQHIWWDIPLRSFFWDEHLLAGIAESLTGNRWEEIVTSSSYDNFLQGLKVSLGSFYALAAVGCLFIHTLPQKAARFLPFSSILLALLALLYCKEKFFHLGQFFEYSAQMITPLLLYWAVFGKDNPKRIALFATVAIALTFLSHGLYALGYYPRPGVFVDMTISLLGVTENNAHTFLYVIGWLDLLFAGLLFLPKTRTVSLYYCIVWGFLTASARLFAYLSFAFFWDSLHQNGFEMVIRLVHGGLPLFLLFYIKGMKNYEKNIT